MNKTFIFILCLFLAACSSSPQVVTSNRNVVISPPETMLVCPNVQLPTNNNITNVQVARLLVEYYRANVICQANMEAIKIFLERARREVR